MDPFEEWWDNLGQFIPPLDKITDPTIVNQFKAIALKAYAAGYGEGYLDAKPIE